MLVDISVILELVRAEALSESAETAAIWHWRAMRPRIPMRSGARARGWVIRETEKRKKRRRSA